jgi:elongation factor 1-alpha
MCIRDSKRLTYLSKMAEDKKHLSLVICGHVDAGKSTTTGRLIFDLGGINQREMDKLKAEAEAVGKGSFAFAFFMDRTKEERARGVTIQCTTKEFFTDTYHYTIIDAPGHRDFIKNMISGASQADIAVIMVPADGNFTTAIARGNHKTGEVQGQTRQHARLINLLGVKQIVIGVNKMDCDVAKYSEARYLEIKEEMINMLLKVGWNKAVINKRTPIIPISGWMGDNLCSKSAKMPWWKGMQIIRIDNEGNKSKVQVDTLLDAFEKMVVPPARQGDKDCRMPVSGVYKIGGVGDVITGRVEQGTVKPDSFMKFLPTHTPSTACMGKVFTVEMHHKNVPAAFAGDNVGLNIKGLDKGNMPRVGDVMVTKEEAVCTAIQEMTCTLQVLDHPGELKKGYTPIAYIRTGRSAVKMTEIVWKMGKETGGQKAEGPVSVKSNEACQAKFEPAQSFVAEAFDVCEGLGRVALLEGNSVVMLGKVDAVVKKDYTKKK